MRRHSGNGYAHYLNTVGTYCDGVVYSFYSVLLDINKAISSNRQCKRLKNAKANEYIPNFHRLCLGIAVYAKYNYRAARKSNKCVRVYQYCISPNSVRSAAPLVPRVCPSVCLSVSLI